MPRPLPPEVPDEFTFPNWDKYQGKGSENSTWLRLQSSFLVDARLRSGGDGARGRFCSALVVALLGHGSVSVEAWLRHCSDRKAARRDLKVWTDNGLVVPRARAAVVRTDVRTDVPPGPPQGGAKIAHAKPTAKDNGTARQPTPPAAPAVESTPAQEPPTAQGAMRQKAQLASGLPGIGPPPTRPNQRTRRHRDVEAASVAEEERRRFALFVEQHRALVLSRQDKPDGDAWWARMVDECPDGTHPILYAYDRRHEGAEKPVEVSTHG